MGKERAPPGHRHRRQNVNDIQNDILEGINKLEAMFKDSKNDTAVSAVFIYYFLDSY